MNACTWHIGCTGKVVARIDLSFAPPGADKNARFCARCAQNASRYQVPITYHLDECEKQGPTSEINRECENRLADSDDAEDNGEPNAKIKYGHCSGNSHGSKYRSMGGKQSKPIF